DVHARREGELSGCELDRVNPARCIIAWIARRNIEGDRVAIRRILHRLPKRTRPAVARVGDDASGVPRRGEGAGGEKNHPTDRHGRGGRVAAPYARELPE